MAVAALVVACGASAARSGGSDNMAAAEWRALQEVTAAELAAEGARRVAGGRGLRRRRLAPRRLGGAAAVRAAPGAPKCSGVAALGRLAGCRHTPRTGGI